MERLANPHLFLFALGAIMTWFRVPWRLPAALTKALAFFLLAGIGLKGGLALHRAPPGMAELALLGTAMALSALLPLPSYLLLRRRLASADAAAVAAAFGSVSLLTFLTGTSFLERMGVAYGGHMVAAMALMEFPAVLVAVALHRRLGGAESRGAEAGSVYREVFASPPLLVLAAGMILGYASGDLGRQLLEPALQLAFPVAMALFLWEMGAASASRWPELRSAGAFPIAYALLIPLVHGALGLGAARLLGLGAGDAFLLALLCGSASYIAVPAAMRLAIPDANPGLYLPMALAVAFPLNVLGVIPVLHLIIGAYW